MVWIWWKWKNEITQWIKKIYEIKPYEGKHKSLYSNNEIKYDFSFVDNDIKKDDFSKYENIDGKFIMITNNINNIKNHDNVDILHFTNKF